MSRNPEFTREQVLAIAAHYVANPDESLQRSLNAFARGELPMSWVWNSIHEAAPAIPREYWMIPADDPLRAFGRTADPTPAQGGEPQPITLKQRAQESNTVDPQKVAHEARAYQDAQAKAGRRVSDIEAVDHVLGVGADRRQPETPYAIAERARAYQAEQADLGIEVSATDAVDHVMRKR